MWTKTASSWKRSASGSTLRSDIQSHFCLERLMISCSAFVGAATGAAGGAWGRARPAPAGPSSRATARQSVRSLGCSLRIVLGEEGGQLRHRRRHEPNPPAGDLGQGPSSGDQSTVQPPASLPIPTRIEGRRRARAQVWANDRPGRLYHCTCPRLPSRHASARGVVPEIPPGSCLSAAASATVPQYRRPRRRPPTSALRPLARWHSEGWPTWSRDTHRTMACFRCGSPECMLRRARMTPCPST